MVDEVKEGETAAERESRLRPRQMSSQQIHHLLGHQAVRVTEKTEIGYVNMTGPSGAGQAGGCGCLICAMGKSTRVPRRRKRREKYSVVPGGVSHFDTAGPFPASIDGKRYAVIGIDEATGLIVVSMDRSKGSKAASKALRMMAAQLSEHGYRLTTCHSDQGSEFDGTFKDVCEAWRIKQTYSATYTPQQNGRAERGFRQLKVLMRCMMQHARLESVGTLWCDAMAHAADLANTVYKKRLGESARACLRRNGETPGALETGEGLAVFGAKFIIHGPALKAQWAPQSDLIPPGVVAFYVGRVAHTLHVMRFMVPDLLGKTRYIETMQALPFEPLLDGPREEIPQEFKTWVDREGPFARDATDMRMDITEFGVEDIEIDDRCPAEQVITRAPGGEVIHHGPNEGGAGANIGGESKTEAGQTLIPLHNGRSDMYEPALHMAVVRYFGPAYKGFRKTGKRNSKPTKCTGWFKGVISMCWVGASGNDKGVRYYRIKYDDGELDDVEHEELRRIIYDHVKAMVESTEWRDQDEANRAAAADGGAKAVRNSDSDTSVEEVASNKDTTLGLAVAGEGPAGVIEDDAKEEIAIDESKAEPQSGGGQRRSKRIKSKGKVSRIGELASDPAIGWARALNHIDRAQPSATDIITRVANGENFDEVTGQLPGNHFDHLELEPEEAGEAPIWVHYRADGSEAVIDFDTADAATRAKCMRLGRITERCRRLQEMPKGTCEVRDEERIGSLGEDFIYNGGITVNHEAGPETIQIVARVEDLRVRRAGGETCTDKIGPASGNGRRSEEAGATDAVYATASGPVQQATQRNFPTDIFSTDISPTEIRDHHSKRTAKTLREVVPGRSSVDPGDARSVGTKNAPEISQKTDPVEHFPRKCSEKRPTRNGGPGGEQTVKIGPSDEVAGNIGPTVSRKPTENPTETGPTDLDENSTEKSIFDLLIANLTEEESANVVADTPQPEWEHAAAVRRWAHDYERSESIECEDEVPNYVFRCVAKSTGKAVYIDEDCPPYRLAMQPGFPNHKLWRAAMCKELREQLVMEAFTLIDRRDIPPGSLILRSNWRLLMKRDARGRIIKAKARAYLAGYSQQFGVHFVETTSPTVRPATLRALLGHAAKYNMATRALDIAVAFLSAKMDFLVLFRMYDMASKLVPDDVPREGMVARANSAIYGCRQSSRQFWKLLSKTLKELGYTVSRGDACLWHRAINEKGEVLENYDIRSQWDPKTKRPMGSGTGEKDGVRVTYVTTFVDDLGCSGSSEAAIDELFKGLEKTFRIKDEGKLETFLGCLIQRAEDGSIHISQPAKCKKAGVAAGVDGETRKPVRVPSKGVLRKPETPRAEMSEEDAKFVDSIDYRAFVGLCLHVYVFTRPEIGYAINQLASHSNDPRREHVEAAKQLGRYLADNMELGIRYDGGTEDMVKVYCDADFADCVDTRRSISGFVIMMYGGAVSWSCRKQPSVALSTMEAEAVALRISFCEVIGLKWDMEVFDPVLGDMAWRLFEDNQSLIAVVCNIDGGKYEARKHIAVRVMWLREVVATKVVEVEYVDTAEQTADVLTKALPVKEFEKHRNAMLNMAAVDEEVVVKSVTFEDEE